MERPQEHLVCYLVGGAVRDELLGIEVSDRDWVVVGSSPQEMERLGFKAVGRDFPVFLHPETREEYALARTERKSGPGYRGFTFDAAPHVTLEEDLARRDLTINAMARDRDHRLVDPYGGEADLAARRLKHVSPAFVEDPVRILRAARFAARFASLGFEVAAETVSLMREIVAAGEAGALVPERVWGETERALDEDRPSRFFEVLRETGALAALFPEIDALFGVPQPRRPHPEIDTGVHTLLALDQAARAGADNPSRFAVLVHDLGKALTPPESWPRHHGHETSGLAPIRALCRRLKVPRAHRELALVVCRHHLAMHRLGELRAASVLKLLDALDSRRRPERVEQFLAACEADVRGRGGREDDPYPQAELLRGYAEAVATVSVKTEGLEPAAIAETYRRARLHALESRRREHRAGG